MILTVLFNSSFEKKSTPYILVIFYCLVRQIIVMHGPKGMVKLKLTQLLHFQIVTKIPGFLQEIHLAPVLKHLFSTLSFRITLNKMFFPILVIVNYNCLPVFHFEKVITFEKNSCYYDFLSL